MMLYAASIICLLTFLTSPKNNFSLRDTFTLAWLYHIWLMLLLSFFLPFSYHDGIKVQTVFQKLLNEIKIFFACSLNGNNSRGKRSEDAKLYKKNSQRSWWENERLKLILKIIFFAKMRSSTAWWDLIIFFEKSFNDCWLHRRRRP